MSRHKPKPKKRWLTNKQRAVIAAHGDSQICAKCGKRRWQHLNNKCTFEAVRS